ncbi:hypothetical protein EDB85DRAFT_808724 [Lactarius pseudohatsudake]|nr:hypothetical protein EDB85DRAFT_808724 [Lactarius pseudohatsudake]
MSLRGSDPTESICAVLTCTSKEYQDLYDNDRFLTGALSDGALRNIIHPNGARLRAADSQYHLDDLLCAMLEHAPHPLGRRYVAVCLHVANQMSEDEVVNIAKAWLHYLLLPILAASVAINSEPTSSQTFTIDTHIESASPDDRSILRDNVAHREQYRCAVTKIFDRTRALKLYMEGRAGEIPRKEAQSRMEAAHVIPLINNFDERSIRSLELTDSARTLNMFRSWTKIDLGTVGPTLNSPTNAIYMSVDDCSAFGHFDFYLDKEMYPDIPNKYRARMCVEDALLLGDGSSEADVEFPSVEESFVEPPNPEYLEVHAAFAKVLNICGAFDLLEMDESDDEMDATWRLDDETESVSCLLSGLVITS